MVTGCLDRLQSLESVAVARSLGVRLTHSSVLQLQRDLRGALFETPWNSFLSADLCTLDLALLLATRGRISDYCHQSGC